MIYNGNPAWTAPEFSATLVTQIYGIVSLIRVGYFKIAINEIPKRELVKIRNAVAAVFYIENSSTEDVVKNRKELVSLLAAVLKKDGSEIVRSIIDRLLEMQKLPKTSKAITRIEDLMEVSSMFETNTKKWEETVVERGREEGREVGIERRDIEIVEKMVENNMSTADIRKITGLQLAKIEQIRKKCKRR